MTTKRIITLAAVGALATVSTVAISMSSWLSASAADPAGNVIRLHIPSSSTATFTYGNEVQELKPGKNTCEIQGAAAGTLVKLTAPLPSSNSKPGIANYGIGVKASQSSGNGNPCAQTDLNEVLKLETGSSTSVSGRSFEKVRLDLEMTGNAVVKLTLGNGSAGPSQVFKLQTGTSITPAEQSELNGDPTPNDVTTDLAVSFDPDDACAAANSSNPNSSGSDNCLWTVNPNFPFTTISLSTVAGGTVALEGSSDFGNDPSHDTLLYLGGAAPVANPDSAETDKNVAKTIDVLTNDTDGDGDPLTVLNGSVSSPTTNGGTAVRSADGLTILYTPKPDFVGVDTFTYQATDGVLTSTAAIVSVRVCGVSEDVPAGVTADFTQLTGLDGCKSNTVTFRATDTSVLFAPDGDGAPVNYRGVISFGPKAVETGTTGGTVLRLRYDRDDTGPLPFVDVPWCINPTFTDGLVTGATLPNADDTWCIATETTTGDPALDSTKVVTTWQVFGKDDPRFQ